MKKILLIVLFSVCLIGQSGDIHKKIDASKDKVERLSQQEKSLTERLDNTLKEINSANSRINTLRQELDLLEAEKDSVDALITKTKKEIKSAIKAQEHIVRNLYISRQTPEIAIIFKDNFENLPRKSAYLSSIANYRNSVIEKNRILQQQLNEQNALQKRLIAEAEGKLSKEQSELLSLEELTISQQKILENIKSQKEQYREALAVLQEQAKKIGKLSHGDGNIPGGFPQKLPWPIKSREIIHTFGLNSDKKFETEFYNPGIDIRAKANEPVYAVADGIVAHVGWLRGYGNIIILKHAQNYYTLYGNLETTQVRRGSRVHRGKLIGDVSPYGWLEGAKLHFEIREGKKELNPIKWLSEYANFS